MPDTTPSQTQMTTEAPLPEDGWRPNLLELRARLDELDDKIHDMLMVRARVVEYVARSGKTAAFRPGREASILRRLLARHTGNLPARTLVRMWREMLAGTTAMQAPITIAAVRTDTIAREHFGFLTPVIEYPHAEAALTALRDGAATIAVLPFPTASAAWWPTLTAAEPRLYVVARLPFWADRPDHVPDDDALVVTTTPPDPSGNDRSFIAAVDHAHLADTGLTSRATHGTIAEVDGMVSEDDPRLPHGAIALGGYAVPVAGEQP